ncbi:phage tail protein, partial [Morganella sp. GD04133]|nr:phage tail protein [Morganella sp. GD04133]
MKLNDIPKLMPVPFGVNGPREELLETSPAGNRSASYADGFPPITMLLKQAGGLPPKGENMNQILFELANGQRWSNSGAGYKFNKAFSEAVGGYPKGAQLLSNDGTKVYVSTKDDNKTDFNTSPGADWVTLGNYIGLNDYATKTDVDKKLDKDSVLQGPGTSTTGVMSQKAVTDLAN